MQAARQQQQERLTQNRDKLRIRCIIFLRNHRLATNNTTKTTQTNDTTHQTTIAIHKADTKCTDQLSDCKTRQTVINHTLTTRTHTSTSATVKRSASSHHRTVLHRLTCI